MAEHIQTGSRRRDWLLRQALRQGDGTYLVRPFGYLPPVVYQVDEPTRDRLVAVRLFYTRLALPAVIIGAALIRDFRSWAFWAFTLGFMVLGYVAPLVVLRRATRVPRSRWTGPAVVAPEDYYSRRRYLTLFVMSIASILLFGEMVRWTLNQPGAAFPWGLCGVIVVMALCAARFWTLYRRSKPKAG